MKEIKTICKQCNKEFLAFKHSKGLFCSYKYSTTFRNLGNKHSEKTKRKIGVKSKKRISGNNNPHWNGGLIKKNIASYDTYASQISYIDTIQRNKKNGVILDVKCTYCGEWYTPKRTEIINRVSALKGQQTGFSEYRLYCSNNCKKECSIYNQKLYPKGFKQTSSREVQSELRQLRFELDNYTCQKCKKHKDELKVGLHCHHIEGIRWEPLESADIDKCITYCKDCHNKVHLIEGCRRIDFICKEDYKWQRAVS